MNVNQMELGLESKTTYCRSRGRGRRLPGARWWFEQMHRAAEGGVEPSGRQLATLRQEAFAFPGPCGGN